MLRDELQPDPATILVDLLHEHIHDVAAVHDVLNVSDAARPDVRDVQQAVRALLQLDERAEVGRLHDLAGVGVADLRGLRQGVDRGDRGLALRALGRVDEDRAVLLDVDLHLVVALECPDRLAALADDHPDEFGIDLDRRDARCVIGHLRPRLGDRCEHRLEDRDARPLRLLERGAHDLLRHAGDLDVHLQGGDPVPRAGHLEVHVTEVILGTLDVGEDDVVVTLFHEAHRDTRDGRRDRHACVHQRERRAAHRAHRRRAVRLERLRDEADRVREVLDGRDDRLEGPLRQCAVADVAPLRASHEARLPDREGREVVVVHVAAVLLEGEVVDPLTLLHRPEREERHDLRLPAREERGAVRARTDLHLGRDLADLLLGASVRPPLVDRDLLADEILVDGFERALDVLLRLRVLDGRLALGRRGADRERQLDLLEDAIEEQVTLRRPELLRVLLGVRELAEIREELLAERSLDRPEAGLLEDRREARANLRPLRHVLLGGVHRHGGREALDELLDDRACLLDTMLCDRRANGIAVSRVQLGGELDVHPLGLADVGAKSLERRADLPDLGMRELQRLEDRVLGDLVPAGLDHRERLARADDDEVERRILELLEGRVEDELVVDEADANGADRPEERQRRDHERRRRTVDAEDVVRRDEICREDGADDLHLVAEALRPERPDRAVGHPRGERRPLGCTALALEEAARDLPGGVHLLLDVDRQREEVGVRPRVGASDGGREDHGLARADDDGAVGLLGELARLEDDLLTAYVDGHRGNAPGCGCTHVRYPFTFP